MKINIALASSRDWLQYTVITATMVLIKSNPQDEYCFYVLSNGFSDKEKKMFLNLKKYRDVEFEFLTVEDSYFEGAIHDWLGVSASYRLRLQTLCKEDKVLYLDTDVATAKDIAELYSIDISDYYLAAVEDKCSEMMSQRVQKTFENKVFFNSGVQLINLKKFREDNIEEQMLEVLRKNISYTDQDVMNDVCFGKILPLPLKYNIVQTGGKDYDNRKEEAIEAQKDPVLLHYWSKPWGIEVRLDKYKLWNDAKDLYESLKEGVTMKFLHTMIRVNDIDASLKFYTEVLNMELDHKKRLDDCWLYFLNDEEKTCQIELTYNDDTPEGGYQVGNGFGHFAFAVDSLDEFTKKIKSLGYDYIYPPFDLNGKGTKIAFIQDPDGYEIELIEKVVW